MEYIYYIFKSDFLKKGITCLAITYEEVAAREMLESYTFANPDYKIQLLKKMVENQQLERRNKK